MIYIGYPYNQGQKDLGSWKSLQKTAVQTKNARPHELWDIYPSQGSNAGDLASNQ
ncbi:MAG: hypothetical protein IMZ53_08110 [Thermoplasmata archaeon]|nr:hypothetical protein [Thermoplasmata archaeon]